VLEIGTLGGYSTIWLARGVGEGGKVVSLEFQPRYAEVARSNLARGGLAMTGSTSGSAAALELLPQIEAKAIGPFDLVFIDADKANQDALSRSGRFRLSRPGP
jgi:predicted O-methyltransferase YrrM